MIKTGKMRLADLRELLRNKIPADHYYARFSDGFKVSRPLSIPDITNCAYIYEEETKRVNQKQRFFAVYDLNEKGEMVDTIVFVIDKF